MVIASVESTAVLLTWQAPLPATLESKRAEIHDLKRPHDTDAIHTTFGPLGAKPTLDGLEAFSTKIPECRFEIHPKLKPQTPIINQVRIPIDS
eukprot:3618548-Amphidinium_carterae.1